MYPVYPGCRWREKTDSWRKDVMKAGVRVQASAKVDGVERKLGNELGAIGIRLKIIV